MFSMGLLDYMWLHFSTLRTLQLSKAAGLSTFPRKHVAVLLRIFFCIVNRSVALGSYHLATLTSVFREQMHLDSSDSLTSVLPATPILLSTQIQDIHCLAS